MFVESISYIEMQRSERRQKGCKKKQKENEKVVRGFIPREIVMIVSAF